jgi:hypothetical protein
MTTQQAFRSLKRTPIFTIAVILSLVLGVGSVGSMFAIVYGVLLAPLPYGEPDRLVSVSLLLVYRASRYLRLAILPNHNHSLHLVSLNIKSGYV